MRSLKSNYINFSNRHYIYICSKRWQYLFLHLEMVKIHISRVFPILMTVKVIFFRKMHIFQLMAFMGKFSSESADIMVSKNVKFDLYGIRLRQLKFQSVFIVLFYQFQDSITEFKVPLNDRKLKERHILAVEK